MLPSEGPTIEELPSDDEEDSASIPPPVPSVAAASSSAASSGAEGGEESAYQVRYCAAVGEEAECFHPAWRSGGGGGGDERGGAAAVRVPAHSADFVIVHPGCAYQIRRDLKCASATKQRGNAQYTARNYDAALLLYSEALALAPLESEHAYSRAVFYSNRAACHFQLEDFRRVIDDCTAAIVLSPRYVKVIMRRAKAFEKLENLEDAIDDLKRVLEVDPAVGGVARDLARLEAALKAKQEAMKDEVLGKLKDLGNTILGKFGMSLDNFKLNPSADGGGGYSISFDQGGGGGGEAAGGGGRT
jgi:hypothetical protein